MKKLFLASFFTYSSQLLLPLLPKSPQELKLAFIPTASDPYDNKPWVFEDRNKLIQMGFDVFDVDLKNKTQEALSKDLEKADVVFVSGGNTYYLMEKVTKSRFGEVIKKLLDRGVIYVGSSAGTAIMCPTIEYLEDLDDRGMAKLDSFQGLGLIDFLILPHYGEPKYEKRFQNIIAKWKNKSYKIQTLTNNQAVTVEEKIIKVMDTSC